MAELELIRLLLTKMTFSEVIPNPYFFSGGLIRPEMQMCFVLSINVSY